MNDNYIEAQESIETDGRNGDRERAYEKQDAQEEPREDDFESLSIMEKLDVIVKQAENLTKQAKELEQFDKYFWDEKHAL